MHYDNVYELPVFNLMKLHGSLTWNKVSNKEDILFDNNLSLVKNLKNIHLNNTLISMQDAIKKLNNDLNIDKLIPYMKKNINKYDINGSIDKFIKEYNKLAIINPTKEKFKETVLNSNYYDLLRIYSTELEKENTVLFVMGFSFSDEHIKEVTVRVANQNPTLKIYIFAHDQNSKKIYRQYA